MQTNWVLGIGHATIIFSVINCQT